MKTLVVSRNAAANGNGTAVPVHCSVCGKALGHIYMWTSDQRRVHIDCYAPALVRESRGAQ